MSITCSELERALENPDLEADVLAHADECERCREQVRVWKEISRLAPELHEKWDSPGLWPRIKDALAAEAPARRPAPWWRWAIATAAMAALAVGLLQPWRSPRPADRVFFTEDALEEVERAEAAYARSINDLAATVGDDLNRPPTPLAAAYREKLLVLDSAIEDLRAAVECNRANVHLRTQLASVYREKKRTLEDWLQNAKRN